MAGSNIPEFEDQFRPLLNEIERRSSIVERFIDKDLYRTVGYSPTGDELWSWDGPVGMDSFGQVYGLGYDIDEKHPRRILAVTAEEVRETARRYLDEGQMVVSCVGPQAERLRLI